MSSLGWARLSISIFVSSCVCVVGDMFGAWDSGREG